MSLKTIFLSVFSLFFILNLQSASPIFDGVSYSLEAPENSTRLIATIQATDPDGGSVTYALRPYKDGSKFRIGSASGKLYFKNGMDFENPGDDDGNNVYIIKVQAKDANNNSTVQQVNVTLTDTNDNAPVLTNVTAKEFVVENHTFVKQYTASDVDADTSFEWSVSGNDADLFYMYPESGILVFNYGEDFEEPTKSTNLYSIRIRVSDGKKVASTGTKIKVTNAASRSIDEVISPSTYIVRDISTPANYAATNIAPYYSYENMFTGDPIFEWGQMPKLNKDLAYGSYEYTVVAGHVGYWADTIIGSGNWMNGSYDDYLVSTSANDDPLYIRLEQAMANPECSYDGPLNASQPICSINLVIYRYSPASDSYVFHREIINGNKNKTVKLPAADRSYLIRVQRSDEMTNINGNSPYYLYAYRAGNTPSQIQNAFAMVNTDNTNYAWYKADIDLSQPISNEYHPNRILVYKHNNRARKSLLDEKGINYSKVAEIAENQILIKDGFSVIELDQSTLIQLGMEANEVIRARKQYVNSDSINGDAAVNPLVSDDRIDSDPLRNIVSSLKILYPDNEFSLDWKVEKHAFSYDADYLRYQKEYFDLINAEEGLNLIGTGDEVSDVVVAVIDTGSPTKNSRAWDSSSWIDDEYDFVDYDFDATDPAASQDSPYQTYGSHGTHVATTIAAKNDGNNMNGFGLKVMPLRALDENGSGYFSDICNAIAYAGQVANSSGEVAIEKADVINMSLGGGSSCSCQSVIDQVYENGVTIVASAGNGTVEAANYPASCNNVLGVSSLATTGDKAYYSNYGLTVDISAPGGDAATDADGDGDWDGIWAFDKDNQQSLYQGTSMAAPIASAVIGNVFAKYPDTTPQIIDGLIKKNLIVTDMGQIGFDRVYGYGMVDLEKVGNLGDESLSDLTTTAVVSGGAINMYNSRTGTIKIRKSGKGATLKVDSAHGSHDGIVVTPSNVNAKGFGTYNITLKKAKFNNAGRHQETVTFVLSDKYTSETVTHPIMFQTGSLADARPEANIGNMIVYNALVDVDGYSLSAYVDMFRVEGSTSNSYSLEDARYRFNISTDDDFDRIVCDFGEICWKQSKTLNSDISRTVILDGNINAASLNSDGGIPLPSEMLQRSN